MRPFALVLFLAAVLGTASAAEPVSPAGRPAASPDLALGPDGSVYLLWVDKGLPQPKPDPGHAGMNHAAAFDVVVARSADGGASFGAPVRANAEPGAVWSFPSSRPRLSVSGAGTVHVFYTRNAASPENGKPVLATGYVRSTDRGATFAAGPTLTSIPGGDLSAFMHGGYAQAQTFGTVLAHGSRVAVYWIDTRHMSGPTDSGALYGTVSTDDGASFPQPWAVSTGDVCPCCQVTAAVSGEALLIGERKVADGFRDSHVARSEDGGRSFGAPLRLGTERWKIDGCPLKPTVLAATGDTVFAAAFNGAGSRSGVRWAVSTDGGRSFGPFELLHPEAAVTDAPALAATGGGVTALWHGKLGPGEKRTVFTRSTRDRGRTWSEVRSLSTPGVESGQPVAVTRADGRVVAAWLEADRVVATVLPADAR